MRRRLTFAILLVVAGSLVVAGLGSLLLERRATTDETKDDLGAQATAIGQAAQDLRRNALVVVRRALRLEGAAVVRLGPGGQALDPLPPGVHIGPGDLDALMAGVTVTGTTGRLAFAVAPIGPESFRRPLTTTDPRSRAAPAPTAVVLTRRVPGVGRATGYFALAGGLALVVAAAVADRLGRRITRPLTAAEAATRRMAGGDLSTRVDSPPGADPELASLARSINAMAEAMARARGLERQFLLSVSHGLRTPLTSIRGFAEAISDGAATDTARAAEVIGAEARRLERLVGDLLDLAKLDARRFRLGLRPVDVAEVVADTAEGFRPAADAAGVALDVDVDGAASRPARVDPDRLAQVVANLVENALKFAASSISVQAVPDGDGVAVSVTDDGPGIPEDDLPRVFERLYQSSRPPVRPVGSGLGLAIVAELVAAMNGSVEAASVPGATRFSVRFRLADESGS